MIDRSLTEKYRPKSLSEIVGQPWAVSQLHRFVANPVPCAFLFEGSTGTGKTSAALALAADLGVDCPAGPLGGLHQIASGEQTAESVRRVMDGLRLYSLSGSGWKVLVVNEADCMSTQASYIWLDALENLPARTVVVFTTNRADRIARRLRDRCECFKFESGYITLAADLAEFVARVWRAETGRGDAPGLDDLGPVQDENGDVSVRRVLQLLTPLVRKAGEPLRPAPAAIQAEPRPQGPGNDGKAPADLEKWGRRWQGGEGIARLAREAGVSWQKLHVELTELGFHSAGKTS